MNLIRITLIIISFMLLSCTSCTKEQHSTDHDDDFHETDNKVETEIDTIPDTQPDEKPEIASELDVEKTDIDIPAEPDCPSLKTANFPYFKENGQFHFCRKCDLPAPADDPQCVKNIMKPVNDAITALYPERDCNPYPCEWNATDGTSETKNIHKCDIMPAGATHNLSMNTHKEMHLDNGKLGMIMLGSMKGDGIIPYRTVEYNIDNSKYYIVAATDLDIGYKHNRFTFSTGNVIDLQSYIVSAIGENGQYRYEAIYTDEDYKVALAYPPAIGKEWIFINIEHYNNDEPQSMLYAKIQKFGEKWEWYEIGHRGQIC